MQKRLKNTGLRDLLWKAHKKLSFPLKNVCEDVTYWYRHDILHPKVSAYYISLNWSDDEETSVVH